MKNKIEHLKCVLCGRRYNYDEVMYTCLDCGPEGLLNVIYKYDLLKENFKKKISKKLNFDNEGILRYIDLLPIDETSPKPNLKVGLTPYILPERLCKYLGHEKIHIKDDGQNPTASFKDRASFIGVIKAIELKKDAITCASTGNAASSVSGICAAIGLKSYIFVPKTAPIAKVAQLLLFGANVFMVDGTYDEAFDLCLKASNEFGWYSRNTGYNPYLLEGKKTCAFEIYEQSNGKLPDLIFVSVGDGCIISGIYKGFYDLLNLGLIEKIPKLIGVQAKGANPFVKAYQNNFSLNVENMVPNTIADSISVGIPRTKRQALNAVYASSGEFIDVSDDEIINALKILPKYTGIFAEPAAATALAGFIKYKENHKIDKLTTCAVIITGNGLKDINTAISAVNMPPIIKPSLDDVKKLIN